MSTNETELKDGCTILMESAVPDIYQKNAFRISGLNVNASTREISNQIQKSQLMEKYGNKTEAGNSPFPVFPPPDHDQIRQALHRLRDPETRVIDEFFWFWPHSLDTLQKDHALEALSGNDIKTAESLWINYEATLTESNVSRHNLAVLSHLLVMDIELNGKSLSKDEIIKRDKYWDDTFKRWKLLLGHEGFWSRLISRVRQMDDPRLTTGFVRRLRESLPSAILQINATLALKAAESGNSKEAIRQINLMDNAGFGNDYVLSALKQVVNPLRNRIKVICKSFLDVPVTTPENDLNACKKLLFQTKEILHIIDTLLPKDNTIKEGAHDEVALAAISLAISYANASSDWETVLPIFEELSKIAIGESARERVKKNYEIYKSNVEYDKIYKKCFYCKTNDTDPGSEVEVKMHGDIKKDYYTNKITWRYLTVKVPRCENCKKQHVYQDNSTGYGFGIGLLLGIGGCNVVKPGGFWALLVLTVVGSIIGYMIGSSKRKTASVDTHKNFPQIKALTEVGWAFGEKPPNVN